MRSLFKCLIVFLIAFAVVVINNKVIYSTGSDCDDYEFIFARGSGQEIGDVDFLDFKNSINRKIGSLGYKYDFYELGRDKTVKSYPAVGVKVSNALGILVSAGNSYEFGESVEKGVEELKKRVSTESKRCKNKKFILAGYSQGALVINKAIPSLNSNRVLYVGNFGDPKLYLPEGKNAKNMACRNHGLSDYRVYVPDCNVYTGVLGGYNPYVPIGYKGKIGVWCNKKDFMCGSSLDIFDMMTGHTSYRGNDNGYRKFAEIIAEKMKIDSAPNGQSVYIENPVFDSWRYDLSDSTKDIIVIYDYDEMTLGVPSPNYKAINDNLRDMLSYYAKVGSRVGVFNVYSLKTSYRLMEERVFLSPHSIAEKIDSYNIFNHTVVHQTVRKPDNNIYRAIYQISKITLWRPGYSRHIIVISNVPHDTDVSRDGITYDDAMKMAKAKNVQVSFYSPGNCCANYGIYRQIAEATGGNNVLSGNVWDIKLNQNKVETKKLTSSVLSYDINKDSEYTLIVINDMVYGVSKQKRLILTGLDPTKTNTINLVPYDKNGEKLDEKTISFEPEKLGVPDSGTL
jgi:hypothetical protein